MAQFPGYYDPSRIGTLFYPDTARIAAEAAAANLPLASEDMDRIHLVIVDMQVDFCHEQGSLYVPGAQEDIRRTVEFIFRNAERITQISCSLDSHVSSQIFSPNWWVDAAGNHPAPYTLITSEDVEAGRWRPLREPAWSVRYVATLEQEAKKQLTIWPYHVLIGSSGHALDPELWSAVFWHSVARQVQPQWLSKGSVPRTEHYSIIQPEVHVVDHPGGGKNQAFLQLLAQAHLVVIVGEAASHCVLETLEDLVEEFKDRPQMLGRLLLLEDCTSPVVHPEIDFGAMARDRFSEFQRQGVRIAKSTDPLP